MTNNKLRVYEYAKSLNMSSKEIITILKRVDVEVNNHMSVMDDDMVKKVERFFHDVKSKAQNRNKPELAQTQPVTQGGAALVSSSTSVEKSEPPRQGQQSSGRPSNGGTTASASSNQNRPYPNRTGQTSQNRSSQNGQGRPNTGGQGRQNTSSTQGRPNSSGQNRPYSSAPSGGQGQDRNRPQNSGQRPNGNVNGKGKPQTSRGKEGSSSVQNQQPRDRTFTPAKNIHDDVASVGKTTKKSKPNQKRFDDNKVSNNRTGGRQHSRGRDQRFNQQAQVKEKIDNTPKKIIVRGPMTVKELASMIMKESSEIIKKLLFLGTMATINQELDLDTIVLIASDYGIEVDVKIAVEEDKIELIEENDDPADLKERPPVVTIMGHVDHGKTTLLDAIRSTKVTAEEAGGITQHIGAYQVEINGKKISFLDTPGHAAFTTMRARGAQVTDITILVVAADDGVMPQTKEAISHAKAANVPIIVAVNKIDKPSANPDRVQQELTEFGLVPEAWGGDTIFVPVSALNRQGIDELLEMILLVAEVQELKANPNKRARGTVIEAELDKGRGAVATVLVQHGTLRVGDAIVIGSGFGKVRAMVNDKGRRIKEAGPSMPVEIIGLQEVPNAGDIFMAFEDERKARSIAETRGIQQRQSELTANSRVTLDDLYNKIKEGEVKDLNIIIKGDVQGSVEALRGSLEKIDIEGVRVKIIHSGVGAIAESDVILASASNAIIIGFNVRPDTNARAIAEHEKVDIRLHRVIYNAIDEIEAALKGMLDPEFKEVVLGRAEVRQVFKVSKVGNIAGCYVTEGKVTRDAEARVIRDGVVVNEGRIDTLKRFKDDAKEVAQGYECGITVENFNDLKEGDIIEAFIMQEIAR